MWEKILREGGFSSVIFPCVEAHALGQQIILADLDLDEAPDFIGRAQEPVGAIDSATVVVPRRRSTSSWAAAKT